MHKMLEYSIWSRPRGKSW